MEDALHMGIVAIIPALLAIVLSFVTRNTIISLAVACITGTLIINEGIADKLLGFPNLMKATLGTTDFSWLLLLNTFIAVLVAFFQKTGAIQGFTELLKARRMSRRGVQVTAWALGGFVYFSDSFSPLFVGSVMRGVSDESRISREKLSYIADSGAAPVSVLVPITGWAAFLAGLTVGFGPIMDADQGMSQIFIKAIPFNFYAIITLIFVLLISLGVIPDFGPMKKAEQRAMNEGKVLRDGAVPIVGKELTQMQKYEGIETRVGLNFIFPVVMIISIALFTFFTLGSAKTMEAFLATVIFMVISTRIQGMPFKEIMDTISDGIKGATGALTLLALAYCINALSKQMGTAYFIIEKTEGLLTPQMLPALIFIIAAVMAFSTGSSWGTFGICMPIALPIAFGMTGGEITPLVLASFGAVAGGGVFGDHCSPLSDTTILASTGSAADHIDHVNTQLPYALICGGLAVVVYLIIGFTMI